MSRLWMGHVTHMNESCRINFAVMNESHLLLPLNTLVTFIFELLVRTFSKDIERVRERESVCVYVRVCVTSHTYFWITRLHF